MNKHDKVKLEEMVGKTVELARDKRESRFGGSPLIEVQGSGDWKREVESLAVVGERFTVGNIAHGRPWSDVYLTNPERLLPTLITVKTPHEFNHYFNVVE